MTIDWKFTLKSIPIFESLLKSRNQILITRNLLSFHLNNLKLLFNTSRPNLFVPKDVKTSYKKLYSSRVTL